jgi:hypothetical protein
MRRLAGATEQRSAKTLEGMCLGRPREFHPGIALAFGRPRRLHLLDG